MSNNIELSEEQRGVVYYEGGALCVKASAGSGKTRVLTERIRILLGKTKKKILALTFTNKAGDEMRDRLKDIPDFNKRVFVGTFHGFCQRMLESHGSLIGFSKLPHIFEDRKDLLELMRQAINLTPNYANDSGDENNMATKALDFISKMKRELKDPSLEEATCQNEDFILLYSNYQSLLNTQDAIDFDDLLRLAYQLLIDFPKIAGLYRRSFYAICIDEAQDLNNAQYQFLLALTGEEFNNLMLVGDPNQSIFHFAGASPEYMDSFIHDFNAAVIELNENYRSSRSILNATRKIFSESRNIPNTVKEGIFEINYPLNEEEESLWVANKIQELVSIKNHQDIEGDITYEKIVLLARNKYVLFPLENNLNSVSIPCYYRMSPGAIEFESRLMKIFYLALRVFLNSSDKLHKDQLVKNMESKCINIEMEWAEIVDKTSNCHEKKILNILGRMNDDGSNFRSLLDSLKQDITIEDDNERNVFFNDIEEVKKHWFNYARKTDNKSIAQFKNSMALGQTHPLTQHQGITLSTVHTMKGQEFDIVFLIGMDDGTFPDYRAIRQNGIAMTQERNNLYVAFTRAKRFLFVTCPQKRTMPWGDCKVRGVSRFLKPLSTQ